MFCMCWQDVVHTVLLPYHCYQPCTDTVFVIPVRHLVYPNRYITLTLPPLPCITNNTENLFYVNSGALWPLVHKLLIPAYPQLFLIRCIFSPFKNSILTFKQNYVQWNVLHTILIYSFKRFYKYIKIMACPGHSFNKSHALPCMSVGLKNFLLEWWSL